MKIFHMFIVLIVCMVLGLIGWFLFSGGSEKPHASHREYALPVTPTEPADLDSITTVISTEGNTALDGMLRTMHDDVYAVYSCRATNNDQQALLLTAQYRQSASGNTFDHAIRAVEAWEANALQHIGSILYPTNGTDFTSLPTLTFSDVPNREYRYAEYRTAEAAFSVYYGWLLNYVIFAPSQECLDQTMHNVYEVGV